MAIREAVSDHRAVVRLICRRWSVPSVAGGPSHLSPVVRLICRRWSVSSVAGGPSHLSPVVRLICRRWSVSSVRGDGLSMVTAVSVPNSQPRRCRRREPCRRVPAIRQLCHRRRDPGPGLMTDRLTGPSHKTWHMLRERKQERGSLKAEYVER